MRFGLPSFEQSIERRLLDTYARELAEQSGVNWEGLNNYPGYCKNVWREMAESLKRDVAPLRTKLH